LKRHLKDKHGIEEDLGSGSKDGQKTLEEAFSKGPKPFSQELFDKAVTGEQISFLNGR
jgi:hypothetical protein